MAISLIGAGSNLGDRAATLDGAAAALAEAVDVRPLRTSAWQMTLPVGGPRGQNEYLNGAMLVETFLPPKELLRLLQQVENGFGRERHQRWGDRTLDLDLLLYDDAVIDTPQLTVPHPRMSFRRFVLEPALEIAGHMVHPTILWSLARLLNHLDAGADAVAIVAEDALRRQSAAASLLAQFEFEPSAATLVDDTRWPADATTWLSLPGIGAQHVEPKLTIQIGPELARVAGRGPTLQLAWSGDAEVEREIFAAVAAVWPHLGRSYESRLQ